MNIQKQGKGIGWTRIHGLPGATWNPTAGCFHNCTWEMPDGSIAECYAKGVAQGVAHRSFPKGFKHHYWYPDRLKEPLERKKPTGIFVGSMADLFGQWVPEKEIKQVINIMKLAHWHTFMILTKNPRRLMKFNPFPKNVYVGVSLPGGQLARSESAENAFSIYLRYLDFVDAKVKFVSFEPLWFDPFEVLDLWNSRSPGLPFNWAIIGAASNGKKTFQPSPQWTNKLLRVCDANKIPVFMKSNLDWQPRRMAFPVIGG